MKKTFLFFLMAFALSACEEGKEDKSIISQAEEAHAKDSFLDKQAVRFHMKLAFGGSERMSGTFTLLTNSTKGLIELDNGDKMLYDIDRVFHSPSMDRTKGVRFDAFTWSYFFLYPYKLSDPGTHWSEFEMNSMNDKAYDVRKLTFDDGTGDSPNDWYVTYFDPNTHLVEAAAYIVTLNQAVSEAEKSPHAIEYSDYRQVEGIPLAHKWTFWEWDSANGLTKQLGEATLSDFEFIVVKDDFFKTPEDFIEAK